MPKRILYVHGVSEIGGAEKELLRLLEHLDRSRFEPHAVCPPDGPLLRELKRLKVPVYPMRLPAWRKLRDLPAIPRTVRSLARLIREQRIDLVHVNDYWWGPIAYIPCYLAK